MCGTGNASTDTYTNTTTQPTGDTVPGRCCRYTLTHTARYGRTADTPADRVGNAPTNRADDDASASRSPISHCHSPAVSTADSTANSVSISIAYSVAYSTTRQRRHARTNLCGLYSLTQHGISGVQHLWVRP